MREWVRVRGSLGSQVTPSHSSSRVNIPAVFICRVLGYLAQKCLLRGLAPHAHTSSLSQRVASLQ